MTINSLPFLEMQPSNYRPIVRISFLNIRMPSREMSSYEAETCIMIVQTDSNSAFVARYTPQPSLFLEFKPGNYESM